MSTRTPHCWADYRSEPPEGSPEWWRRRAQPNATCLLPDRHRGPHEWTPDDQIIVTFPPRPGATPPEAAP